MLGNYFDRELRRMPAMDIADIAYDRFLANGRPELVMADAAGKTIRLRVVSYENFTLNPQVAAIRPKLYQDSWYAWGEVGILSNMTEGFVTTANTRNNWSAEWEVGWGQVEKTEWEALLTWNRYINRFFSVLTGADIGNAIEEDRAVAGIRYLLPIMLETRALVGSDGGARATIARKFELTPRLSLDGLVQYDTDSY